MKGHSYHKNEYKKECFFEQKEEIFQLHSYDGRIKHKEPFTRYESIEKNSDTFQWSLKKDGKRDEVLSIEVTFNNLATSWKRETAAYSTTYHKTINNNYLGIIGMGYQVVPFILKDLIKAPEHWYIALKAIAKVNPVSKEDMGDMRKMRLAWIEWGKKNNLI